MLPGYEIFYGHEILYRDVDTVYIVAAQEDSVYSVDAYLSFCSHSDGVYGCDLYYSDELGEQLQMSASII